MVDLKGIIKGAWEWGISGMESSVESSDNVIDVNALAPFVSDFSIYDGNKFAGGLGVPQEVWLDYWALRLHSAKLFKENLYARGLIRRLVTNEITTGLNLEATPSSELLGALLPSDDARNKWSEDVESRFQMWAKNPKICDFKKQNTFGSLQRMIRRETLIEGDVLVVLRQSRNTKIISLQVILGGEVQTPLDASPRQGNKIIQGVEIDQNGVHVAYWVRQENGASRRLSAFGERSGRRIAWLVYGTDKRLSEIRGEPMLSLILQSLKEIDRYRDSAQRKAVINSILAMFIQKDEDKPGTKPVTGGAVRKDSTTVTDPDGSPRTFNIAAQIPGMVVEELQHGEVPKAFGSDGTDVNFGVFESAMIQAIAWANEIPPEILTLAFQSNYSASRGAVNEFKMYLDKSRSERADELDSPVYTEWLLSEVLRRQIKAPGLVEAWRDPSQYVTWGAWTSSDWAGAIKPSVDLKKEVQAYLAMVEGGLITRARAARELTGMKYSKVIKQLLMENTQLAEALRPLLALGEEFKVTLVEPIKASNDNVIEDTAEEVLKLVAEGES